MQFTHGGMPEKVEFETQLLFWRSFKEIYNLVIYFIQSKNIIHNG